jgi:hypothetical protein
MFTDTMSPSKKSDPVDTWPPVFRIPEATRERLVRLGATMSKRAFAELPPAVVVRAALERGLDELERELGITRGK